MMSYQHERPNPLKPFVCKLSKRGMWWAEVLTPDGRYLCKPFFYYQDALAKAYEYAALNAEATK